MLSIKQVIAVAALMVSSLANASWPERPINIIVPFTPGGVTDGLARIAAERLQGELKVPVVVENKPGAFGAIAAEYVKRQTADGYTLFMGSLSQLGILPHMQAVRFDPRTDFDPISIIGTSPMVLAASIRFKPDSIQELISLVKRDPQQVSYASSGAGATSHLTMEMLWSRAQVNVLHVPYKGGAPAIADVLGGQVPLYFGTTTDVLPFIKSGKLKALAVASEARLQALPQVPTVAEQGFPGFVAETWNGLVAPAGTPPDIIKALSVALSSGLQDPSFVRKVEGIGAEVLVNTPEAFRVRLNDDYRMWGEVIRAGNISNR